MQEKHTNIIFIRECFLVTPDGETIHVEAGAEGKLLNESGLIDFGRGITAEGVEEDFYAPTKNKPQN